jgi:hypothetical protein
MPNPRADYVNRLVSASRRGFALLRELEELAGDYADLGYDKALASEDLDGTNLSGIGPEQVRAAVVGIVAIGEVVNANDGANRKAFKVLAQYAQG